MKFCNSFDPASSVKREAADDPADYTRLIDRFHLFFFPAQNEVAAALAEAGKFHPPHFFLIPPAD